jgi:hypothetical protein
VAADPEFLAERLAVFAAGWWGPHADRRVTELRRRRPDTGAEDLRQATVTRSVRTCVAEGSFIGGPFAVLIPFAFCSALLVQIRMILELAALTGRPATEPDRVAEVLVIQGVQPDVDSARRALAAAKTRKAEQTERRAGLRRWFSALWRMMRLLGLLTPDPATEPGRLVRWGRWVMLFGAFAVGTVLPLIWLPYMAAAYRSSTLEIAKHATAFYYEPGGLRRIGPEPTTRVRPEMAAALVRVVLSVIVMASTVSVFILLKINAAGGRWPTLVLAILALSLATGAWWLWRRRRARRGHPEVDDLGD